MSGNRLVVDTNIAIHFLLGDKNVEKYFYAFRPILCFITELELISGSDFDEEEIAGIQSFISKQIIIDYVPAIKPFVIEIRRQKKIKLPDAIIAATAMYFDVPLVTSDKGFKNIKGLTLIYHDPTT